MKPVIHARFRAVISNAGKSTNLFNVALIDKKKAPEVSNLLALCPRCYGTYSIDDDSKLSKALGGVKQILVGHNKNLQLWMTFRLKKGLSVLFQGYRN